jgi:hypothetical protein
MNPIIRSLIGLSFLLSSACTPLPRATAASAPATPIRFAVLGDAGQWEKNTQLSRDSMLALKATHLVMPGDNIYSGKSYDAHWKPFADKGFTFDAVAIGNHTLGYKAETAYFKMPGEHYSKLLGDVARFIVLNSDNTANVSEQAKFLDQELQKAREQLVFVVFHHPSYTVANHGHVWTDKKDFQLAVRPLFVKHRAKITALLLGHDHLASLLHFDDLPAVVSGAAREVRQDSPVSREQSGVSVKTAYYFESVPTWVMLTINPDQPHEASVDFVRSSDNKLTCSARLITGKRAELSSNCAR